MPQEFLTDKEKSILDLNARRKLYNIVGKFAGSHFREIERICKLPTGSVQYHLNFLVKQNLITKEKDKNNLRYYPRNFKSANKLIMNFLRQSQIRKILVLLLSKNLNHEELTKKVNISPSTVSWHLGKLLQANIITFKKEGRKTYYHLLTDKAELVNLLITYKKSFMDSLVDNVVDMWETK